MKLNKIKQIMQNPETLLILIKSRDEESVRRYLSIKQRRKKMNRDDEVGSASRIGLNLQLVSGANEFIDKD